MSKFEKFIHCCKNEQYIFFCTMFVLDPFGDKILEMCPS